MEKFVTFEAEQGARSRQSWHRLGGCTRIVSRRPALPAAAWDQHKPKASSQSHWGLGRGETHGSPSPRTPPPIRPGPQSALVRSTPGRDRGAARPARGNTTHPSTNPPSRLGTFLPAFLFTPSAMLMPPSPHSSASPPAPGADVYQG